MQFQVLIKVSQEWAMFISKNEINLFLDYFTRQTKTRILITKQIDLFAVGGDIATALNYAKMSQQNLCIS